MGSTAPTPGGQGLPESAPVLSFDTEEGSTFSRFHVDYERLADGIADAGMPEETAAETSIHFSRFHPAYLGTNAGNSLHFRINFKLPEFLVPALYDTGLRKHQGRSAFKVGINTHPQAVHHVKEDLRKRHDVSRSNVSRLSDGDCLSLIVAHEIRHFIVDEEVRGRAEREHQVRKYISQCVQRGRDNPWSKVIKVA